MLVRVDGASKKFCRSLKRSLWYGVKDMASEAAGRSRNIGLRPDEFWAVNDVSFELRRGDCLGLIGRNGAGKTTLLKMLNGLIKPDKGRIELRGRVGALIALGAGFNPILSGLENIYVNGAVLGLSKKEIEEKIEDIIDFADIRDFIDSPVQSYSSGMQVRLGFAVATALNPDVLLLDEVLAVGDVKFRAKCYRRIGEVLKSAAVIYVAHDMNQIGLICNEVMVLREGQAIFTGLPATAIEEYLLENAELDPVGQGGCESWEAGLSINSIRVEPPRIHSGAGARVIVEYTAEHAYSIGCLRCNFVTDARMLVADYDSQALGHRYKLHVGKHTLEIPLGQLPLARGRYSLNVAAFDESLKVTLFHAYDQPGLVVDSTMITTSIIEMGHTA